MKTIKDLINVFRPEKCKDCDSEFRIKYEASEYITFSCDCRKHEFLEVDKEIGNFIIKDNKHV